MSLENVKINSPNTWFSNSGPERSRFPRGPERPLEDADKKTLTHPLWPSRPTSTTPGLDCLRLTSRPCPLAPGRFEDKGQPPCCGAQSFRPEGILYPPVLQCLVWGG